MSYRCWRISLHLLYVLLLVWSSGSSHAEEFRDAENETSVVLVDSEFDDVSEAQNPHHTKDNRHVKVEHVQDLSGDIDPNVEPFIPRREWQEIKTGQAIPPGLHVRINFQTRIREAKILDNSESHNPEISKKETAEESVSPKEERGHKDDPSVEKVPKIVRHEPVQIEENTGKIYFTKSDLKHALKDFKDKFHNVEEPVVETEVHSEDIVTKNKFRSMEDIRSNLEHLMGHSLKSDVDIMKSDVETLKHELTTSTDKAAALDNLENYVHQLDNGMDLEKIGGLAVVTHLLNSSDVTLQGKAARVLGSACQSNPFVQSKATEHGALHHLLHILLSTDGSSHVKKSALFALSALVRGSPPAQAQFTKLGGIAHILAILKDDHHTTAVRIKAMNLIADLVTEQRDLAKEKGLKTNKAVTESPLESALVSHGWCAVLPKFLLGEDKDIQEKTLQAMTSSVAACQNAFMDNGVIPKLESLASKLKAESAEEQDQDYGKFLAELSEQALAVIKAIRN